MALSQLQCLDDNHVNPRTHESKAEFFYCEDQRLALEALLRGGRETLAKFLEARGLRGFLSDLELDSLTARIQPYNPGSELFPESAVKEEEPEPLSLHYWPDLSDTSVPQMDLGWPDSDAYRGVTRTTVYTQPPMEGQTHVKEVVRKMISQAQKVIAVVMDVFTDVDIFRDLLDAGYKKKVSVYILLERTNLPHFLSMCERANMHTGHLKHLRVRCTEGTEFYSRSCTKVTGRMGHRFMFIDGDKAVSGSYGFTWMSSRLDRNLITVITGQAVDGLDRLFRFLYASSSFVDLRQVVKESEPEPERLPQPAAVVPPSADVARKLYNPKYALVAATNPSPTTSVGRDSPKEPQTPENPKKKRRLRDTEEDGPPLHPGLANLEKAYMIPYLPTWPEPDPPSDVIGFINIRDTSKPTQVHLQRSEMFETSQAIRFSSPFTAVGETLPEVAKPRQLTVKYEDINKLQPALNNSKTKDLGGDRTQTKTKPAEVSVSAGDTKTKEKAPEQISPTHVQKSQPNKDTMRTLNTDNKLHSHTTTSETPYLSAHTALQSSSKAPVPNNWTASQTTHTVSSNRPKSELLQESKVNKGAETVSSPNMESVAMYRAHTLNSDSTKTPQLPRLSDSNSRATADTHTQAIHTIPGNISTPSAAVSSTVIPEKNHITTTTVKSSTTTSASVSTTSPTSPHPLLNPLLSTSSSLTSAPPVPKPRTVQLLIKDDSSSNESQVCLVRKPEASAQPAVAPNVPPGHTAVPSPPVKESQTVPQLQDNSKTATQKHTEDTGKPKESLQQTESVSSHLKKGKEADGQLDGKVRTLFLTGNKLETKSEVLVSKSPQAASVNSPDITPKDIIPKTLISTDQKMILKTETDYKSAVHANTQGPQKLLTEKSNEQNVTQPKTYLAKAHEPQSISYYRLTPQDVGEMDAVDFLKEIKPTAASTSHKPHTSRDNADSGTLAFTHSQRGKQAALAPAQRGVLTTAAQSTHSTFQEADLKAQRNTHAPEKNMRLQLPDRRVPELRALSPERAPRPIASPVRTPTPDRFLPRTPTPDSQMPTPDPRSYTPDFRTPTPDVSDGYLSSREDSNLSTTSEEYYECSDSPSHEPVFEHLTYHNHGTTEDHVIFTHKNTPNSASPGTSPAFRHFSPDASTPRSADRNMFWSESETLSGPARGSSSSVIEKRPKIREAEDTNNDKNGRGGDEKGSVAGRRAERESLETERRDSEEADRTANHFKQDEASTETAEKSKEVPRRKRVLNQSVADRLIDRGGTAAESMNERTELKRLSSGDLKPGRATSEGKGPDKGSSEREKLSNLVALRPNNVERREKSQSSKETEEQKPVHTPPKAPRVQQQDSGPPSSSRPPRPPRPLSGSQYIGSRPWGSRPLNQTESKVLEVLEGSSSAHRPPSRPPLPTTAASGGASAGRRQVSPSQQGIVPRQPSAGQSRTRAGQTQNQSPHPKPQASFLHTHSNAPSPLHSPTQSQAASTQEGLEEGKTPFSFTFSKLYNLRGLKDKIGKTPAQSRKGSSSSSVEGRKSTS